MDNSSSAAFYGGNQHSDVLYATPSSASARSALVDELKRRGNAAFQVRSLAEADVLYSKAIEHDPEMVALYGNRSMARAGMGNFAHALEDAVKATQLDPNWSKGYFRKAMAEIGLKKFEDANESLQEVLKLEPGNKAAVAELDKLPAKRQEWEAAQAKEAERKAMIEKEKEETAASRVISRKIISEEGTKDGKSGTASGKKASKDADLSMRGYRTLADGRKTTYFNRELTEEEKELLKDNKPKQVEAVDELSKKEQEIAEKGASAWNQGGTFEEKAMTEWARERLKSLLVGAKVPVKLVLPSGESAAQEITVKSLDDLEGDASIAFTRGKKRHIFYFSFSTKWTFDFDGKTISGTLHFPEVSGDVVVDEALLESELRWSNREHVGSNQDLVKSTLTNDLNKAISRAVHEFAREFRNIN